MLATIATNAQANPDALFLAVALGAIWLWIVVTIVEGGRL